MCRRAPTKVSVEPLFFSHFLILLSSPTPSSLLQISSLSRSHPPTPRILISLRELILQGILHLLFEDAPYILARFE
jgi:hypothetical protein